MKKRIGSKLYDTETSERICHIDGGWLYRKKTRGREWWAAFDDGTFRPLDISKPADMALMASCHLEMINTDITGTPTGSSGYVVHIDKETHEKLTVMSKEQGIPISQIVKKIVSKL